MEINDFFPFPFSSRFESLFIEYNSFDKSLMSNYMYK